MAITVKHKFVSAIPDGADTSVVRPSNWNDDHQLTGTIDVANGGTGASTANGALTNLLPSQTGNNGKFLSTDGTNTLWSSAGSGDVVGPSSATDNAIARFDTTTGKLIQNSVVTIDDAGNIIGNDSLQFSGTPPVTQPVGTLWYDGTTETLNFQQNNITQQIGEELFVYGKASSAITDSPLQIVYKTGTVGASGVITFAPTVAGITNDDVIIGVATENIALNATGRVTCFGVVHNITTNGAAYGETWADGDTIWYNPVTGNPTKTKPTAPNVKCQIGTVINAGAGGSGSFQVEIIHGTSLGGTDSNVNITSATNGNILTYDGANSYWKNTDLTAGTGISVTKSANGVLTVTNTSPSSGGTVTSITAGTGLSGGTITSSGTIAIDSTVATLSGTQTLTNKTITARVSSTTSISSPLADNSDNYDMYAATAQAGALTISADAGTPTDGRKIQFRFTCDATPRVITFTGGVSKGFKPVGVTMTASGSDFTYTLTASKTTYFGAIYNTSSARWEIVALSQEA